MMATVPVGLWRSIAVGVLVLIVTLSRAPADDLRNIHAWFLLAVDGPGAGERAAYHLENPRRSGISSTAWRSSTRRLGIASSRGSSGHRTIAISSTSTAGSVLDD